MDFGDEAAHSTLGEDRLERCKKCGNIVDNGQCTVCKHVELKFEKLRLPLDEVEIEPAGFQRWFIKTMDEGVSIKVLEYVSHGLLGMLGLLILTFAIISIIGFGVGPLRGILILVAVCLSAIAYASLIYKGHQFLRDPNAQLNLASKTVLESGVKVRPLDEMARLRSAIERPKGYPSPRTVFSRP